MTLLSALQPVIRSACVLVKASLRAASFQAASSAGGSSAVTIPCCGAGSGAAPRGGATSANSSPSTGRSKRIEGLSSGAAASRVAGPNSTPGKVGATSEIDCLAPSGGSITIICQPKPTVTAPRVATVAVGRPDRVVARVTTTACPARPASVGRYWTGTRSRVCEGAVALGTVRVMFMPAMSGICAPGAGAQWIARESGDGNPATSRRLGGAPLASGATVPAQPATPAAPNERPTERSAIGPASQVGTTSSALGVRSLSHKAPSSRPTAPPKRSVAELGASSRSAIVAET